MAKPFCNNINLRGPLRFPVKETKTNSDLEHIIAHHSPKSFKDAAEAFGFTPERYLERLFELMESEDQRISIQAIKEIRMQYRQQLELNGLVGQAVVKTVRDPKGHVTEQTVKATQTRLMSSLSEKIGNGNSNHTFLPANAPSSSEGDSTEPIGNEAGGSSQDSP